MNDYQCKDLEVLVVINDTVVWFLRPQFGWFSMEGFKTIRVQLHEALVRETRYDS